MRINKNIKLIINYLIGPLLLALIIYDLIQQFSKLENLDIYKSQMIEALTWQSMMYVFFVIVFMILQWVMEAIRWRVLTKGLLTIDLFSALKMIFTGLSFSMITPNRSGEFIGRVVHIPSEKRIVASAVTIYGSAIQWVVYCLFGTISLYLIDLNHFENQKDALLKTTLGFLKLISPLIALGGFCIVLCVGYFSRQFISFKIFQKIQFILIELEKIKLSQSFYLFILTLIKSAIFIIQYWMIFRCLGLDLDMFQVFIGVAIMVYGLAILPTISFLEIGLRWEMSYHLFSIFTPNVFAVTIGTTSIYLINIVVPALIGAFLLIIKPKHSS